MTRDVLFDDCASALEALTSFDRLEARGTLRIALREAGFEPDSISVEQLRVVVTRVLPELLTARGVSDPTTVCEGVTGSIQDAGDASPVNTPDRVFERLSGS